MEHTSKVPNQRSMHFSPANVVYRMDENPPVQICLRIIYHLSSDISLHDFVYIFMFVDFENNSHIFCPNIAEAWQSFLKVNNLINGFITILKKFQIFCSVRILVSVCILSADWAFKHEVNHTWHGVKQSVSYIAMQGGGPILFGPPKFLLILSLRSFLNDSRNTFFIFPSQGLRMSGWFHRIF